MRFDNVWIWLGYCLSMVWRWFDDGLAMVWIWCGLGSAVVWIRFKYGCNTVWIWSESGLHVILMWFEHGLTMGCIWLQYGMPLCTTNWSVPPRCQNSPAHKHLPYTMNTKWIQQRPNISTLDTMYIPSHLEEITSSALLAQVLHILCELCEHVVQQLASRKRAWIQEAFTIRCREFPFFALTACAPIICNHTGWSRQTLASRSISAACTSHQRWTSFDIDSVDRLSRFWSPWWSKSTTRHQFLTKGDQNPAQGSNCTHDGESALKVKGSHGYPDIFMHKLSQ